MSDYPPEWIARPLGDIAERIRRTSEDQNLDALTISSTEGWVEQRKKWARDMAGKSIEKYTLLHKGEFSYNRGNSKTYPQGCIFRLESWDKALVPNIYHSFRICSKDIDGSFLQHFFAAGGLNDQLRSVITSSVRDNGLLNITADTFFSSEIPIPPLPERKKIAEILSGIDRQIQLYETKIKSVESQKKALLNDLYGEPFENEDNLQDICTEDICYGVLQYNEEGEGCVPVIQIRNLNPLDLINLKRIPIALDQKYARSRIQEGDLLISVKGSVGKTAVVPKGFSGNISRDIARVRSKASVISARFLQYWFASDPGVASLAKIEVGTTRAELSIGKLRSLQVSYPSVEEQHKICRVARSTEKTLANLNNIKEKYLILKKAISMDLLSGRKRVRV
jgi:type I restriction enzyme S subunit